MKQKIQARRLYLAPLKISHAKQVFLWCGDEEATRYMSFCTYENVEQVKEWLRKVKNDNSLFGIFLNDGTLIGSISCLSHDVGAMRELGYCMNKNFWGKGYCTEAAMALLEYCTVKFGSTDFFAKHAVENDRSRRVIEKCGFVFDRFVGYSKCDGSYTFTSKQYNLHIDLHKMNLTAQPFERIASGQKTIEMRLNDERRQNLKVGDYIEFTHNDNNREKLTARVKALYKFANFAELYKTLDLTKCGYLVEEIGNARPEDMAAYYTSERLAQYGALGIELEYPTVFDI